MNPNKVISMGDYTVSACDRCGVPYNHYAMLPLATPKGTQLYCVACIKDWVEAVENTGDKKDEKQ